MPTLPLLTLSSSPDAWHNVTAPGGYEWWYFDAEDVANDRQVVAILLDGFVFHPHYLRLCVIAAGRPGWRRRCRGGSDVRILWCMSGKILAQFMRQYPAADFRRTADRPDVVMGTNQFHRADDGSLNLRLHKPVETDLAGPATSRLANAGRRIYFPAHICPSADGADISLSRDDRRGSSLGDRQSTLRCHRRNRVVRSTSRHRK